MAALLKGDRGWWAVDKLIAGYLVLTGALILSFYSRVPRAGWLVAEHAIAILLIIAAARRPDSHAAFVFRHWYPLPYVAATYREMAVLIPAIRRADLDRQLAELDYRIWGAHPTVWLERVTSRPATELLQILYSLFVPAVLLIAAVLWRRRDYVRFRYYAFLIALGFLASYVGYFLVPARGPRFVLAGLQHMELRGYWFYDALRASLDRLESAHYDCFPSGHTELTVLAWWGTRWISNNLFRVYFVYTCSIIFATVYLRYHYTVDVLAGAVLAALLICAAPPLYKNFSKGAA